MAPEIADRQTVTIGHLLGGVRAGVNGALLMLLFSMAGSAVGRRSIWSLPNLFATTFYGEDAYRSGFHRATWPGLALYFVIYASLGAVWGMVARDESRFRNVVFSALFGLIVYYAFFHYIWDHLNPVISLYAADGNLRAGHVLWGLCLSRSARYARYIREASVETPISEAPEPRSGEVIL